MSKARFYQLVNHISAHPGYSPLASKVLTLAMVAWRDRDVVFPRPGSPTLAAAAVAPSELPEVADVDWSEVFRRGAKSSEELDALTALTLLGASAAWPTSPPSDREVASCLLWLETYTGLRCLGTCDAVFDGPRQRQLGEAILGLLATSKPEELQPVPSRDLSTAEMAIGHSWLSSSEVPECRELAQRARALSPRAELNHPINGDLGPRPRHPFTTALFALTGVLFLLRAGRALGRWVLRRRTPTSLWISARGLELFSRHEMLGRTLRERRIVVPIEDIRSVEREVRFPRCGLYAGLVALALGTLLGTRLFVDGLRVAGLSFPLIAGGLVCVVLGIVLDMVLSGLSDSVRGQCRLVVVPRRGRAWAIGELDSSGVDRLLTELATQLSVSRPERQP